MHKLVPSLVVVAALLAPVYGEARSGGHSTGSGHHGSSYCFTCARDGHGRIERSEQAKEQFMRDTGYPHGRPGYVVDHIVPLKRGGADAPYNMQWQTKEDAK